MMESTIFKNTSIGRVSGVLNGPVTLTYGLGGLTIILIDKYILAKVKINKYLKVFFSFLLFSLLLTLVEGISGYLCELIFNTEMWNYSSKIYHLGKYMCLLYTPLWGLLGLFTSYILKPFTDKVIKLIPREVSYFFIFFLVLDITITLITK